MKPKAEVEAPKAVVEEEAKSPLDFLPTSNFHEHAIERFWGMFDPEVYSLWFCIYKHDDKNTRSAVIMNKLGEFFPQMDPARSYGFGKMLVTGNKPPFKLKGLWLFYGTKIPHFFMNECYDFELYDWTKVDPSDEAQKKHVNKMIEDMKRFEVEALLDIIA